MGDTCCQVFSVFPLLGEFLLKVENNLFGGEKGFAVEVTSLAGIT